MTSDVDGAATRPLILWLRRTSPLIRVALADGTDYFARAKREIAPGAREFIGVTANCANGAVRWRLRLHLLVGRERTEQYLPVPKDRGLLTCECQPVQAHQRAWVCSPVVMTADDALERPHLHDEHLDVV